MPSRLSAHTFCTGLLSAGIRLGCLTHIDAQRALIEAREEAARIAALPVPPLTELSSYGIEAEIAVMQSRHQRHTGIRQLGSRKSGRCTLLLTPTELERLTIYVAAELARKHKAKGLKLNHPEAVAYIVDEILEGAREGRSVADLISWGSTLLTSDDVMPGVAELMPMIQVEGTFPDGTKLVTVHDPIRPGSEKRPDDAVVPGEIITDDGDIELNAGRRKVTLKVVNTGDRPIQIGSHYHFFETNKALDFDRAAELRHASRHSGRHRRALRPGRGQGGGADRVRRHRRAARPQQPHRRQLAERGDQDGGVAAGARARLQGSLSHGQDEPQGLRADVWPDHGRRHSARRHVASCRGRA